MKTIAINEKETLKISQEGDVYRLCDWRKRGYSYEWMIRKRTTNEWLVSKWIIDNDMKTAKDYPTLSEIVKAQKKHKEEKEKLSRFEMMDVEENEQ